MVQFFSTFFSSIASAFSFEFFAVLLLFPIAVALFTCVIKLLLFRN